MPYILNVHDWRWYEEQLKGRTKTISREERLYYPAFHDRSYVLTDKGYVELAKIKPGSHVKLWDGEKYNHCRVFAKQEMYLIVTGTSEAIRVMYNGEIKLFSDVGIKSENVAPRRRNAVIDGPDKKSRMMMYTWGFLAGRFPRYKWFKLSGRVNMRKDSSKYAYMLFGKIQQYRHNKLVLLTDRTINYNIVPFTYSLKSKLAYLAGFFDYTGKYSKGQYFVCTHRYVGFLRLIKMLLQTCGISSKILPFHRGHYNSRDGISRALFINKDSLFRMIPYGFTSARLKDKTYKKNGKDFVASPLKLTEHRTFGHRYTARIIIPVDRKPTFVFINSYPVFLHSSRYYVDSGRIMYMKPEVKRKRNKRIDKLTTTVTAPERKPYVRKMIRKFYFDGAMSEYGAGLGFHSKDMEVQHSSGVYFPDLTKFSNNVAEHLALTRLMEWLIQNPQDCKIGIYGDSQLVINQMKGLYRISPVTHSGKEAVYYKYGLHNLELRKLLKNYYFSWIRREQNTRADELSKLGLTKILIKPQ